MRFSMLIKILRWLLLFNIFRIKIFGLQWWALFRQILTMRLLIKYTHLIRSTLLFGLHLVLINLHLDYLKAITQWILYSQPKSSIKLFAQTTSMLSMQFILNSVHQIAQMLYSSTLNFQMELFQATFSFNHLFWISTQHSLLPP